MIRKQYPSDRTGDEDCSEDVMDWLVLDKIYQFTLKNDFSALYKAYNWGNDNWISGFSDIFSIEKLFMQELSELYLSSDTVMQVVRWGKFRNPKRVNCPNKISFISTDLLSPVRMYK